MRPALRRGDKDVLCKKEKAHAEDAKRVATVVVVRPKRLRVGVQCKERRVEREGWWLLAWLLLLLVMNVYVPDMVESLIQSDGRGINRTELRDNDGKTHREDLLQDDGRCTKVLAKRFDNDDLLLQPAVLDTLAGGRTSASRRQVR
jgi:hypothetical protein